MNASFYPVYSSFWNLIPFSLPVRPVSALDGLHLIKFCTFLSPFRMGLTNPGQALGRSCLLLIFRKLSTLSGIPPFSTNSFWLACLLASLVGPNLSFLIGALVRFIKITKVAPFASVEVFRNDPFLGPVLFSLFINDLPASLPSYVSCSLYADDLAIWSSSPSVPIAVETTQGARSRLDRWSQYWCLPLNPSKCEASFFSVDPHQANLQPNLLLLGSHLHFNPTPTFLGVTFDRTLSFSKHVSSLKAKFFPRLKALGCISASSWGLSLFCIKLFFSPFSHTLPFPKRYQFYQIGTPPPSGQSRHHTLPLILPYSSSPLRCFFTSPTSHPDLFHFFSYDGALRLPTSFPISGLARLGVKPRLCRSSWRAFASTHRLMLPSTSLREALLACPTFPPWNLPSFTVESTLTSPCSRSDPPLSCQNAALAHLDSLSS